MSAIMIEQGPGRNMNLIAEGVEMDPQLEYLKSLGCTEIQGWLFGKAESAEMTSDILSRIGHGGCLRRDIAV
jgi:EAL domain-containing protein (putative c-di-GMP-specific phosphodiesterase class I)